uniref:Uncharacterized protein n=1 Tax=mine drainage metagenome TaxID=410659 RepID=E6PYR0_9ZZZZ
MAGRVAWIQGRASNIVVFSLDISGLTFLFSALDQS